MQTIRYTDKQKKELYDAGWKGSGKGQANVRAVKMVRPTCNICQIGGDELVGWWDENPEHDHYWNLQAKTLKVPKYVVDEDGDMVLDVEATKKNSKTKFVRMPDIIEVLKQAQSNAGIADVKFRERKGFKLPIEVGVAPLCELYGCGKSWPTIRTQYGDYCSERHAKFAVANETEVKFTVWVDPSAPKARNLISKELNEVAI